MANRARLRLLIYASRNCGELFNSLFTLLTVGGDKLVVCVCSHTHACRIFLLVAWQLGLVLTVNECPIISGSKLKRIAVNAATSLKQLSGRISVHVIDVFAIVITSNCILFIQSYVL